MSRTPSISGELVDAGFVDERADEAERLVRARVAPPAAHAADIEIATEDVGAVHVGDLELVTLRALEPADDVEDVRAVAVEADDRVMGGRPVVAAVERPRLLNDVCDPPVLAVRDNAETLWVGDLLDEDLRARAAFHETPDRLVLGVLEDVVPEADHELLAGGKALRHADDLCDPPPLCGVCGVVLCVYFVGCMCVGGE